MSTNILDRGKMRVGVLRGGPSLEYATSLAGGAEVLKRIPERFVPIDIYISRDGVWHIDGIARSPERILAHVDVVWNALHGKYGEDGKVQNLLEIFGVPYTGSRPLASAFGMNKNLSKALFQYHGLKTPEHSVVYPSDNTYASLITLFQSLPQPSVVKPISGGSGVAVKRTNDFTSWRQAIEEVLRQDSAAVVEEYIPGIEITCAVLEGKNIFTPLFSFAPTDGLHDVYINEATKEEVWKLALDVHKQFKLRHYSSVDVIVHPTRRIYLLEVDTQPSVAPLSRLPQALKTANISMEDFIDRVLTLAMDEPKKA